ncbi:hypothetical protein LBMAG21_13320 [Armatimonadota bacterium]|nr:hypothetical protein LBMAG21_13320 [Armatimonadota bacterium]
MLNLSLSLKNEAFYTYSDVLLLRFVTQLSISFFKRVYGVTNEI